MSASDPGWRRVCVHAGADALDLVLPAAVPIATLIPSIVGIFPSHGADAVTEGYRLSQPGASALAASTTLAQNNIHDGTVLILAPAGAQPPALCHHDPAEAVSSALTAADQPSASSNALQLVGAVTAGCFTGAAVLALIRDAFDHDVSHHSGSAAVSAAAAVVALAVAALAGKGDRDAITRLTLSLIAVVFAATAGLLAVPGALSAAHVLLAAMVAAVMAVLALRVTGCGSLSAVAGITALIAGASLARTPLM